MDTVYILAALLLAVLAFAIYQLTKKSEVEQEIEKLMDVDESYLLAELNNVSITVWICFLGGLLLTLNYAITYFSGSSVANITQWGFTQWSGAFIGAVVTVAITSAQKVLYSSPSHQKAGLLVTTAILIFVIFSEIGSPIEKEEMKMKEASQNSATYKAVVGAINHGNISTAPSAYSSQLATAQAEKAKHTFELGRCNRHAPKGQKRIDRCKTYENRKIAEAQAQIDSYQQSMKTESQNNQATSLALVDKAKALENNTDNHSGLIKFVKESIGTTFLNAMMLASLILVVAFEVAFHFVGSREGILRAALMRKGNQDILYASEAKRLKKANKFKQKADKLRAENKTTQDADKPEIKIKDKPKVELSTPPSNWQPATAFTSNEKTGTKEKQYDMFPKTGKYSNRLSTGNKGGVEVVQAMKYETLKAEIDAGKIEPTTQAIAQRIFNDKSGNLIYPKCEKVAESILNRYQKENQNNRPSSSPSEPEKRGAATVANNPPSDPSDRVQDTPATGLKEVDKKDRVKPLTESKINRDDFDNLYRFVSGKIADKTINLSMESMTNSVRDYIKNHKRLKKTSVAIPECRYLANEVRDRMLEEGIIKENPNYKNGLPKYLVA